MVLSTIQEKQYNKFLILNNAMEFIIEHYVTMKLC